MVPTGRGADTARRLALALLRKTTGSGSLVPSQTASERPKGSNGQLFSGASGETNRGTLTRFRSRSGPAQATTPVGNPSGVLAGKIKPPDMPRAAIG